MSALIAITPCGCVSSLNTAEDKPSIVQFTAEHVRDGDRVEVVEFTEGHRRLQPQCPHEPKWGRR